MDKYAKPFNEKPVPITPAKYFKVLTGAYFITLVQLIILLVIALVLVMSGVNFGRPRGSGVDTSGLIQQHYTFGLYMLVAILTMGGAFGGQMLFNKKKGSIKNIGNLYEKLKAYRLSVARQSRLLETAGLTSIVVFLVTGQFLVLISPVIVIGLIFYQRPTKKRLINDLQLSNDEVMIVNDPDGIVG